MNNLLTIVIPSKNEEYGIIQALNEIGNEYRIIVADSSDDIYSEGFLKIYAKNHAHVRLIPGGLPAVARNAGAMLVETPYILFLDADVLIYDRSLIEKCLREIDKKNLDLVTIKMTTIEPYYRWIYTIFNILQKFTSLTKPFALGGFMLFRTQTFRNLGGFNESDKVAEDYHLSMKIKPKRFMVVNKTAFTPARRFQNKGIMYMTRLAILCWLNRNNDKFFTNDQNYWK
jgi:glycosyltransferase involved in cell wall biosynthesis